MTSDVTFTELSALAGELLPERTVLAADPTGGLLGGLGLGGNPASGILPLGKGGLVQKL